MAMLTANASLGILSALLIIFIPPFTSATEASIQRLSYGDACEIGAENLACDIRDTLACINGTCQCLDPASMVYDSSRGLCVGQAGHRCITHSSETSVSRLKRNSCVLYSSCESEQGNQNGTCKCWSSFYRAQGLCLRKRDYLYKCSRDEECNGRKGLICNRDMGICTCHQTQAIYNSDTERCIGIPNKACGNVYRECTENYKCKGGVCRCKFKEVETANGTLNCDPIQHKYGKPCTHSQRECGDEYFNNLQCLDGKCRCKNPDYQKYDYDRRVCVSKVGGPCSIPDLAPFRNGTHNSKFDPQNFPIISCISYAECIPRSSSSSAKSPSSSTLGVCECSAGFMESKQGFCHLPVGSECSTTIKNKKDVCFHPLKCVNGRCNCENAVDVFESDKCARAVKSLCWKNESCVKNAFCKQPQKNYPGRCKCKQKFRASSLGTCI